MNSPPSQKRQRYSAWSRPRRDISMGAIPDYLDNRDKTVDIEISKRLPTAVDLREWCPDIKDQGELPTCAAHAATSLLEYFHKRVYGKDFRASRLFLYEATKRLMPPRFQKGLVPTFSRTTMKALSIFGVPPESVYPYDVSKLDEDPSAFYYAYAARYRAISYHRLDIEDNQPKDVLRLIKASIALNRPVMFCLIYYPDCHDQAQDSGKIPLPAKWQAAAYDPFDWAHNMVAVGYDNKLEITNLAADGITTTGALLVKNSHGTRWGENGYGWLPYDYVLRKLSVDWWTILKADWLDAGVFDAKHRS